MQGVISDMNQMLADFIRAQLTLAALPGWFMLRLLGGNARALRADVRYRGRILEFIPVVGPLVGAVLDYWASRS